MEFADFCADHDILLGESLRRAEAEYNRRPNHLHALETFAWTLHKNGRSAEALPFIERAMRLETQDAMVEYRAGRIYLAAGQTEKATAYLRQALMHNLHIESTLAAAEARILIKSLGPA
jgi:Flp pilus assembly protein TadD